MRPGTRRLAAAALLAAASCGCWRSVDPVDLSDAGIKARVVAELRSQPGLDLRYVTVNVGDRVVTVSGMAANYQDKELITRIARRARGVEQAVVNLIVPE